MVQEITNIIHAPIDLTTGNVHIKMQHTVRLDDGRELQNSSKPDSVYINFSEVIKTPLVTADPVEETRIVRKSTDANGNEVNITEKFMPVKDADRRMKYNEKLQMIASYIATENRIYRQVKSLWEALLLEKAAEEGTVWEISDLGE